MTRRPLRCALALLAASLLVTLAGCSDSKSSAAGTYELDKEAVKAAIQKEIDAASPEEQPMMQGMSALMLGMIDAMDMTITLNADGTATGSASLPGEGNDNATGTWTLDGDKISITLATEGSTPDTMSGTLKGDVIELVDPDEEMNLILRKKS